MNLQSKWRTFSFVAVTSLTIVLGLTTSGCLQKLDEGRDVYSMVVNACNKPAPRIDGVKQWVDSGTAYTMPDECYRALTETTYEEDGELRWILNFTSGWTPERAALQYKVVEAFYILLSYPIKRPPNDTIWGQAPHSLPGALLDILDPEENHDATHANQRLFNYVVNRFEEIRYQPAEFNEGSLATYEHYVHSEFPFIDAMMNAGGIRILYVPDAFWGKPGKFYNVNPFTRASILVHEARHGDGFGHDVCVAPDSSTGGLDYDCDPDISGAYGFGAIYGEMLLHGSADQLGTGTAKVPPPSGASLDLQGPLMSDGDVTNMSLLVCGYLKTRLQLLKPELREFFGPPDSYQDGRCGELSKLPTTLELRGMQRPNLP